MASSTGAPRRYFSRSWQMLTSQKGWYKPVLLLALGMFVPIFGLLALLGYALEWARLTAWNVDAAPKQKGVRVGACIAVGWRGAVVMFVWNFLWLMVVSVLRVFLGLTVFSAALELVIFVAAIFLGLVIAAACLRSAIYTKIGPGLSFARVWEMLECDYKGLFSIVGIPLVSAIVCGVLVLLAFLIAFLVCLGDVAELVRIAMYPAAFADDGAYVVQVLCSMLAKCVPAFVVFDYLFHVVVVVFTLLEYNAVGLWMRQFDVANWGGPKSTLPDSSPSEKPIASYEYDEPAAEDAEAKPASPVGGDVAAPAAAEPVAAPEPVSAPDGQGAATQPVAQAAPARAESAVLGAEPADSQEPVANEDGSEVPEGAESAGESQPSSVLDEDIAAEAAAFAMSQTSRGEAKPADVEVRSEAEGESAVELEGTGSEVEPVEPEPEATAAESAETLSPEPPVKPSISPVPVDAPSAEKQAAVTEPAPAPAEAEEVEADVIDDDEAFGAPVLPGYSSTRVITVEETDEFGDKHRTRAVETVSETGGRKRTVEVDEDDDEPEIITTLIPPRDVREEEPEGGDPGESEPAATDGE